MAMQLFTKFWFSFSPTIWQSGHMDAGQNTELAAQGPVGSSTATSPSGGRHQGSSALLVIIFGIVVSSESCWQFIQRWDAATSWQQIKYSFLCGCLVACGLDDPHHQHLAHGDDDNDNLRMFAFLSWRGDPERQHDAHRSSCDMAFFPQGASL